MSSIFNLNTLLQPNFIPDIRAKVNIHENYLSNAISILEEVNDKITDDSKEYISKIEAASDTRTENKIFGDYFNDYKNCIKDYQNKMNELFSNFAINIENIIDANSDLLDMNTPIVNYADMALYKFDKLDDPDYPKIKPYKVFKREYKFFGKLLQDLGYSVPDETKVKVIASVYNNLKSEMDDDWMLKCMQKISDSDDCKKNTFAKCVFDSLVQGEPKECHITEDLVMQAKLALLNNSTIVNAIKSAVDMFNSDLDKVADEFGSMLFRNKDLVLDVKTDQDGIEDRRYQLSNYSFNQVNIFMNLKKSQISEICNLFLIALSIKMDCAIKYIKQCIDIITTATTKCCNQDMDTEVDPDLDDDLDDDDDISDNEIGNTLTNDNDNQQEPQSDSEEEIEDCDFADEMYLFEATVFEYNRALQNLSVQYDLLSEANIKETMNSIIDSLLNKITELVNKFLDVINNNQKRIDFVKNNTAIIKNAKIAEGQKIETINVKDLLAMQKQQITFQTEPDIYASETAYFNAKYAAFKPDDPNTDKSIKDKIISKVIGAEKPFEASDVNDGITYITTQFRQLSDSAKTDLATLKSEKRKGELLSQATAKNESAFLKMYFTEADEAPANNNTQNQQQFQQQPTQQPQNNNNQNTQQNDNNKADEKEKNNNTNNKAAKDAVTVYFKVNTNVLAAKMTAAQKVFNIYYNKLAVLATPPTK